MVKYFSFLACLFLLPNVSCKKVLDSAKTSLLEKYFKTNILTRNFTVTLATDSSADITADYAGEIFVLLETDLYHGPLKATKNGVDYNGTWSANSDYSQLIITLPNPPAEFAFLSRAWRFTSKNVPTMALAPWGSTAPIALQMTRQ
jgi:hypothetical protein